MYKTIGEDVRIAQTALIARPHLVSLGNHIAIDDYVNIRTSAEIGDYVHISTMTTVIGGEEGLLVMGHFSFTAAGGRIICASDDYTGLGLVNPTIPAKYRKVHTKPVVFEPMSGIGTNVVVVQGVRLGIGSIVGSNSLVTKDTEPWTVYYGNPAKPVKARRKDIIMAYVAEMGYEGEVHQ